MHNQDFEKSVQQRMEELSFTPSASVWEKVQADIRPHKRRRVVLWLLPLALVIGASGWWFLQQELPNDNWAKKGKSPVSIAAPDTTTTISEGEKNTTADDNNIPGAKESIIGANPRANQSASEPSTSIVSSNESSLAEGNKQQLNGTNSPTKIGSYNRTIFQPEANNASEKSVSVVSQEPIKNVSESGTSTERSVEAFPLLIGSKKMHELGVEGGEKKNALLHKSPSTVAKRGGWQWGAQLHYGFANIRNGGIMGRAPSASFSNASPWPPQGSGGAAFRGPNPQTELGTYLSAGITIQRNLGRNVALGTGIQYESFSQRQGVGEAVNRTTLPGNTSADALQGNVFYRDQNKSTYYHNKVQLISIPLTVHIKPMRRVPLELVAGIHTGYIMAAKSLQYDTASRLYYATAPAVHPLQVSGVTRVQYTIANRGSWQLMGGPQVNYQLRQLNKTGNVPQRLYAYSLGLQLRRK